MGLFNRKVTATTKLKAFLERSENIDVRDQSLSTYSETKAIGSLHPSQAEDLLFTLALSLPETPPQEFASLIQAYAKESSKFAMLKEITVEKEERSKGIGSILLERFISEATARNATHLFAVGVQNEDNPFNLVSWYNRNGFVEVLPANAAAGTPALLVLDLS